MMEHHQLGQKRINQVLIYRDKAVVQLPKSGSNTLHRTWHYLQGTSVSIDLRPCVSNGLLPTVEPMPLTMFLREPLDRYWAALRQDYMDTSYWARKNPGMVDHYQLGTLADYLHLHEQKLEQSPPRPYDPESHLHYMEDITYRLCRIMRQTRGWWSNISLVPVQRLTAWCLEHWGYSAAKRHNQHDLDLVNQIALYRARHPEIDDRVRNLPRMRSEYQLWDCLHSTLTPAELTRVLLRCQQHEIPRGLSRPNIFGKGTNDPHITK